jgi:hypothetical protein
VFITIHLGAYTKPLLQWKSDKDYALLCVCWEGGGGSCVGALTRACACARVALLIQHATHRHIVISGPSLFVIFFDIS